MGAHGAAGIDRFLAAQDGGVYEQALAELAAGAKRSHWMWFVFPQVAGLGRSQTARFYAIADLAEARSYLAHHLLGPRLQQSTDALLSWAGQRSAETILGPIDAMKFRSSMTLFEAASPAPDAFGQALESFFGGERDGATLTRL